MNELRYIKKEHLKLHCWYNGSGRGSHVGFWDGKVFHTLRREHGVGCTTQQHYEDGGPFVPVEEITPSYQISHHWRQLFNRRQ